MSNVCRGCKARVAIPTRCPDCGTISHPNPNCLARTMHPWCPDRLLSCKPDTSTCLVANESSSLNDIRYFIRKEFQKMLHEFVEDLGTEFEARKCEINSLRCKLSKLSDRLREIENNQVHDPSNESSNVHEL